VQAVLRRLQLASGLLMLTYLFLHLVNHALGIASLDLAGRGLVLALRLWRSTPGTIALYGAASVHFALALHTIYGRRHWALPAAEWIRLWAGLSLPMLLIRHAVTLRSVPYDTNMRLRRRGALDDDRRAGGHV
jgi:adenylate cyclase